MEGNVDQWRREGQSFLRRFLQLVDILDPTTLLASNKEIENAHTLLQSSQLKEVVKDEKIKEAVKLTLSSVHPDTGNVLPTVFRVSAFAPFASPLIIAILLPHKRMKPALLCQLLFQSYSAGYNLANGNKTTCKDEKKCL